MRISGTIFAETDRICDYIPFVSTVSNLIDLFQKCVVKCLPEGTTKNRYWSHIKDKDLLRCFILLIPILGNIYILVADYFEYKKDKVSCREAIQSDQRMQRTLAGMLAMLAKQSSGIEVSADQMMPAPTEDEQRLWVACHGSDLNSIRQLLDKGINPNFYHSGNTPLVTACQNSTAAIVRLLIDHGAEVNTPDRLGNTPLEAACAKGNLDIIRVLHPHIHDINASNHKGATPLMFAASGGDRATVAFLREQGADPHKVAKDGSDAVICAIFLEDHAEILPMLFEEHEDIDARKYQFQIPSFNFSFFAPPTIQNLTPLLYATLVGKINSAMYLLTRSDVRSSDSSNSTALYYSVRHLELLRAILEKCSTPEFVNQQNIAGSTALHHAIELGQPEAAILLLKSGADSLIADKKGKTSLILACEKDLVDVVSYIQQHQKINSEMQEQVFLATQAAEARRGKDAPPKKGDLLSSAFSLMQTGLKGMQSIVESEAKKAKEIEELSPIPRTGMEMFLGKLAWPLTPTFHS